MISIFFRKTLINYDSLHYAHNLLIILRLIAKYFELLLFEQKQAIGSTDLSGFSINSRDL